MIGRGTALVRLNMRNFKDETPATIELHTRKFLETNNFSYAMSAFCRARENGQPIPEIILESLEKSFLEWEQSDGERSLDAILGIRPGRGSKSAITPLWKTQRDEELFYIMAKLTGLGWRVSEAAEGACACLQAKAEANPENHKYLKSSNAGRREDEDLILDTQTLADYWHSRKNIKHRKEARARAQRTVMLWSDEEKADYQNRIRKLMGIIS